MIGPEIWQDSTESVFVSLWSITFGASTTYCHAVLWIVMFNYFGNFDLLSLFFFAGLFLVIPECSQYKFLNGSDRHRDYYIVDKKCDKDLTEDWYRFYGQAGSVMASNCVPTHRCNTDLPGWMEGSLPTVDEGIVLRKVCFHGYRKCCYKDVQINVRNCGPFYIYRLKKLTFCSSRYCGSN